jgi:hypothetical protein
MTAANAGLAQKVIALMVIGKNRRHAHPDIARMPFYSSGSAIEREPPPAATISFQGLRMNMVDEKSSALNQGDGGDKNGTDPVTFGKRPGQRGAANPRGGSPERVAALLAQSHAVCAQHAAGARPGVAIDPPGIIQHKADGIGR